MDFEKLKVAKDLPRQGAVFSIKRVGETSRYVFGGSDFKVHEVDLGQEKPEPKTFGAHESYVTGIALAGKWAVSGGYDRRLIWWDLETKSQTRSIDAHQKWIRCVAATPDGKTIASVADDMVCRLWDAETGALLHELRGHGEMTPHHFPSMLFACAISADGRLVATTDKVGHVVVWEIASGRSLATFDAPVMYTWDPVQRRHSIGGIRAVAFSPDGQRIAVGGIGKISNIDHLDGKARVEVFDWEKKERTHEFPGDKFNGLVEHLQFLPGGEGLLAMGGAADGFLIAYDLKAKTLVAQEKVRMHVQDFVLDPSSDTFIVAGHGRILAYETKA